MPIYTFILYLKLAFKLYLFQIHYGSANQNLEGLVSLKANIEALMEASQGLELVTPELVAVAGVRAERRARGRAAGKKELQCLVCTGTIYILYLSDC